MLGRLRGRKFRAFKKWRKALFEQQLINLSRKQKIRLQARYKFHGTKNITNAPSSLEKSQSRRGRARVTRKRALRAEAKNRVRRNSNYRRPTSSRENVRKAIDLAIVGNFENPMQQTNKILDSLAASPRVENSIADVVLSSPSLFGALAIDDEELRTTQIKTEDYRHFMSFVEPIKSNMEPTSEFREFARNEEDRK